MAHRLAIPILLGAAAIATIGAVFTGAIPFWIVAIAAGGIAYYKNKEKSPASPSRLAPQRRQTPAPQAAVSPRRRRPVPAAVDLANEPAQITQGQLERLMQLLNQQSAILERQAAAS